MGKYISVKNWRMKARAAIIASMGGKCQICNYDKCKKALECHHIDPSEKEVSFSNISKSDDIAKELCKCILLCANCHREVHDKHLTILLPNDYFRFDQAIFDAIIHSKIEKSIKKYKKNDKDEDIQQKKQRILESNIDFSKSWQLEVAKILDRSPCSVMRWLKKHLPTILDDKNTWSSDKNSEFVKNRINMIEYSGIDYTKRGWTVKLSKLLKITPQKTSKWIKKYMPEFYKLYSRKISVDNFTK